MGKIAIFFLNLRKENWIYRDIRFVFKLLSANEFSLNNCRHVELELKNERKLRKYVLYGINRKEGND